MRERGKWIAAAASIWIQCSCGASYAFGIYSSALKSSQGYDQSTLDTVSVFKDIGANVGVISGFLYSAVASRPRSGPWVVHLAGAIQCFAGYFFLWLSVTGAIPRPPVGLMCLFMFLAAHAQTFFNTANVVTAVHNFPDYSGTIVGIMKGFLGLSGAVLIQMYQALFRGSPSTFLLMLALMPTLLSFLLMWFVRIYDARSPDDKKHLNGFSLIAFVVASHLMLLIILENILIFPSWAHDVALAILLVLLSSPISVVIKAQTDDSWRSSQTTSTTPLIDGTEMPSEVVQHKGGSTDVLEVGENMNLLEAMGTINFWLLFVAMVCGMGSGLATINNISQIGESLGYSAVERSTLVSLWSIWNFLGRFGAGYLSDILLHSRGLARPFLMTLTLITMSVGHVVIAFGFPGNLYVGSILVGVCYGSQWSLMPTIASEIFGMKHMGTIFNTIAIASPIGSYIFSVRVIGHLYDELASGNVKPCYGVRCFMLSFFIMASVSLVGFLAALVLYFKTRKFYEHVLFPRLRHSTVS